jgi:hypothetical protein
MKNLFKVSALVLGLGLGFVQSASADVFGLGTIGEEGQTFSSNVHVKNLAFSDEFDFSIPNSDLGASFTASFGKSTQNLQSFEAVLWQGATEIGTFDSSMAGKKLNSDLSLDGLSAGNYQIHVNGVMGSVDHAYTGSIAVSPVPEAEEWAMMVVGLGLIGVVAGKKKEGGFKIANS